MIYTYKCLKCTTKWEFDLPMKDSDEPMFCPECGQRLRKIITVKPIIFKAKGFYKTDRDICNDRGR